MDTVPSVETPKMPRSYMTKVIKLKDHPLNRSHVFIPLKSAFGFLPENIAIEKVPNSHDKIIVRVFLTDEQMKLEDEAKAKEEQLAKEKTSMLEAKMEAESEVRKEEASL